MTNTSSIPPGQEPFPPPYSSFQEVSSKWNLKWLHEAMTQAKRDYCRNQSADLTHAEWQALLGVLCGYSAQEMSQLGDVGWTQGSIQQTLTNGVYPYVEQIAETLIYETVRITKWNKVSLLLKQVWERHTQSMIVNATIPSDLWQSFEEQIKNGRYSSWSAVIHKALQKLEEEQGDNSA